MLEPRLSPFPHHTWLGFWRTTCHEAPMVVIHLRQVRHRLGYLATGRAQVRVICHGREEHFDVTPGTVEFSPADGEEHTLIGVNGPACTTHSVFTLLIPESHIAEVLASEGVDAPPTLKWLPQQHDPLLSSCMSRLSLIAPMHDRTDEARKDEAARRLILRLAELNDGVRPDWHFDSGAFDGRRLEDIVAYIDANLQIAPSLRDIALIAGLSPSHFAKKFRISTGLGLHRFVNLRRIQAALELLEEESTPLAHVAINLGFSHQSHFTRLFSELTGMTPAKYRKQIISRKVAVLGFPATSSPPPTPRHGLRRVPR